MEHDAGAHAVEFGRTRVSAIAGEPIDQPVQAIICPANARGVVPAGGSSSLRISTGADVERELRALAPLDTGTAVVTFSGNLASRGIERLIHAVVTDEPGASAQLPAVRNAVAAALGLAQRERLRSLALPLLGLDPDIPAERRATWIAAIVDEVVAHLRRDPGGLDTVAIVSRYPDDQTLIEAALVEARTHSWRT